MKAAKFDYVRPASLAEATAALASAGIGGRVLAGGQSLVPQMAVRELTPSALVDLRRLSELDFIELRSDHVAIGAMTRHRTAEISALLAELVPLVPLALARVAYPTVRNQGTSGGSLVNADHRAELPAVAITLGASIVLASVAGQRVVPASEFFLGDRQTTLAPGEILTEWRIPLEMSKYRWAMDEFTQRHRDFPVTASYAGVLLGPDGVIKDARLTIGATAPVAVRVAAGEALLVGRTPSEELVDAVLDILPGALDPVSDRFGDAEYRITLAQKLTRGTLRAALGIA